MARAPGSDGQLSYGGYLVDIGERRSELRGTNLWVTQDNLIANVTIVAAAIGAWLDLAGSSKWTAIPNPRGGNDAKLAADLVQEGVIDVRMDTRWRSVVKRQGMKKFRGLSLHAKGWRRDTIGRIVLAELAHRPPWSIEKWIKPLETEPWTAVVQRTHSGNTFEIARDDLFYSREGTLGDDPRGVGLLRHLVAVAEIFNRYRQLQGIAFDTDANGIPIGRAPIGRLYQQACLPISEGGGGLAPDDGSGIAAYVAAQTNPLRDLIENRVVNHKRSLVLDSLPYFSTTADGAQKAEPIMLWGLDTLRQQIGSIPDLGKALFELNTEMARVLGVEYLMLDGSGGAFALSADKTNLHALRVNGLLDDLGDDAERDIVPDILARNGITDERLFPLLQHEPVSRTSVMQAADALAKIASAKLKPGDPAENVLRARMELPPAPEPDEADLAAWRASRGDGSAPNVAPSDKSLPDNPDGDM